MAEPDWSKLGSAYHRPEPNHYDVYADVDRNTATGEMLRRYWHPIAVAEDVSDLPYAVRVLGEDLVLFKTPSGEFGLVYPRCIHRGTQLIYGRVEDRGIRCCYHGWLFDTEGTCVERPCEPENNQTAPRKQPWYPVEVRYGLVFAYMGPPDLKPPLPSYDILEDVPTGYRLVTDGDSIGAGGPDMMPCNWFQTHENVMDPLHVFVLHSSFSSQQFGDLMAIRPKVDFETTEYGVISHQYREYPDGRVLDRVTEVIQPTIRIVADPTLTRYGPGDMVAWTLPIDKTNTKIFTVMKWPEDEEPHSDNNLRMYGGKTWFELDDEGHRRFPGDFEAQVSQGPITLHSEETLATSDRGVAYFRKQFKEAVAAVNRGEDPVGTHRAAQGAVKVRCGNFLPDM